MKKRAAPVKLDEVMTILNDAMPDKSEPFTTEELKIMETMLERDFNAAVKRVEDLKPTTEN